MKKYRAFTMIELISVLVVLGIIASFSIPRLQRDTKIEAMNHMLSMIRYTQSLALHDNKVLNDNKWQRRFWRFEIKKCANGSGIYYKIGTDMDMNGGIEKDESAIDPANSKYIFWYGLKACPIDSNEALRNEVSPNIFITHKYNIKDVVFKNCAYMKNGVKKYSSAKYIGFDRFGRYYKSFEENNKTIYNGINAGDCKIEFQLLNSDKFTIIINKETGYTYIKEYPNL